MKKIIVAAVVLLFCQPSFAADVELTNTWAEVDAAVTAVKTATYPTKAQALVGSCTVGPCLDGTSDGGDLIKLYGPLGFWTALQAGSATANRSWRLPIGAAPSAGTTRLLNLDEYGQMGQVDPATFEPAKGADDNYVTDAELANLEIVSNSITNFDDGYALLDDGTAGLLDSANVSVGEISGLTATTVFTAISELLGLIPTEVPAIHYGYDWVPLAGAVGVKDGTSPPDAAAIRGPYTYRTFASDAAEDLEGWWKVPPDMNATDGRVWFSVSGIVTATTGPSASEGVAFGLKGVGIGSGDPTGYTKGTASISSLDEMDMVQWDYFETAWAPVTIGGVGPGKSVEFNIYRAVAEAVDDYGQLVGPYLVNFRYVKSLEVAEAAE